MKTVTEHVWRTGDGRYVRTGDPSAQTLAYAPGDMVDDKLYDEIGFLSDEGYPGVPADEKARRNVNDKAGRAPDADKQAVTPDEPNRGAFVTTAGQTAAAPTGRSDSKPSDNSADLDANADTADGADETGSSAGGRSRSTRTGKNK